MKKIETNALVNPLRCDVVTVQPLTDKILQVLIEPHQTQRFHYHAGQYIKLLTADGNETPFSIANAPLGSRQIELHIRHTAENHYSHSLLNEIKQTGCVHLTGPFGQCTWQKAAANRPLLFLAGGTGFAPIKALIEQALADEVELSMHLYWVAKTRSDLYLDELPQAWAHRIPHFRYTPLLSEPDAEWHGKTGRIYDAVKEDYTDLSQTQIFAAGPGEMVFAALNALQPLGLVRSAIYSDAFEFLE